MFKTCGAFAPATAAGAFSGLPLPQLLHCSRHWKLRLEQEGHTQSPALGEGDEARCGKGAERGGGEKQTGGSPVKASGLHGCYQVSCIQKVERLSWGVRTQQRATGSTSAAAHLAWRGRSGACRRRRPRQRLPRGGPRHTGCTACASQSCRGQAGTGRQVRHQGTSHERRRHEQAGS